MDKKASDKRRDMDVSSEITILKTGEAYHRSNRS